MGEVIAQALGRDLKDCAVYAREGVTGSVIRPPSASPPSVAATSWRPHGAVRGHGRAEISHKSSSRAGYAQGSLRAARFLAAHRTGLFDMFDVLGLND